MNETLSESLAEALVNKGLLLSRTGRLEEALRVYGQCIERFQHDNSLEVRVQVARALMLTILDLGELLHPEDACAAYDRLAAFVGQATEPELMYQLAVGLMARGDAVVRQDPEEAIATYAEVGARFGDIGDIDIQRIVEQSKEGSRRMAEPLLHQRTESALKYLSTITWTSSSLSGSTSPFCGAAAGYVAEVWQGTGSQQVFHGPIVFFTDAIVFILPPWKERLAKIGVALLMGGLTGKPDAMTLVAGSGVEERIREVNGFLGDLIHVKYGTARIKYQDLVAEFGDWAEVWPNSLVVAARMKTKGLIFKQYRVTLKPDSGLTRGYECGLNQGEPTTKMLSAAFGSRFLQR